MSTILPSRRPSLTSSQFLDELNVVIGEANLLVQFPRKPVPCEEPYSKRLRATLTGEDFGVLK